MDKEKQQELTTEQMNDLLAMNIQHEYNELSKNLDRYHAIFYQIWEMGYPRLSFEVPTAAVKFDRKGKRIEFIFNPIFWKNSDAYTREFVICHECLHVILNHGMRIKDLKSNKVNNMIANQCLDVVINHMLVDRFNFDRQSIQNQENYCWIDTVFGADHAKVEKNRAFEYYFGLLKGKLQENIKNGTFVIKNDDGSTSDMSTETVDVHDFLDSIDDEDLKKELADEINKKLNEIDKKDFVDKISKTGEGMKKMHERSPSSKNPGTSEGGFLHRILSSSVRKKKKWETVIKKWSLRYKSNDESVEQWARKNRRIEGFATDLLLPSDFDEDSKTSERIEVWFFLDTSGSCIQLKDRFFQAAESLPNDKFLIKLFCFDTKVYEVNIKDKQVYGGGGTSFRIIEQKIQQEIKKQNRRHPEAVFVISDGYGDTIMPQMPKKWYWFLTTNYKSCIPKESNIYYLANFE